MRRRTYLRTAGAVAVTGMLAGCSGGGDGGGGSNRGDNEVLVGPDGSNVFEPEELTVSTGDTVTWTAKSAGHNVECYPSKSDEASLPEGAEPFASYDSSRFTTMSEGDTYEHTFEVAGTYEYICYPHVTMGMTGTIVVE